MNKTTKTAQFTPGPWVAERDTARNAYAWKVTGAKGTVNDIARLALVDSYSQLEGNAALIAAAPAMYGALSDAEGMWNIARLIDSKHHAGNPIPNDLWSDFHQYLMEWYAKRKAALAQAEGRQA